MALYGNLTADGDTDTVYVRGTFMLKVSGTWGGGTVTLHIKGGDGTFRQLYTATALTSDSTGQVVVDLPDLRSASEVKATLAGGLTPSLFWEFAGPVADHANF